MKTTFLFGALVLTTGGIVALADPPQYTLQFLGEGIKVEDMNENGLVTGWRLSPSPAQGFVAGPDHPFELLPLPEGYISSLAADINDAGVVVGSVHAAGQQQAAAWYPDGQGGYDIDLLGSLPGHEDSAANAINNRGEIVGVSFFPGAASGWSVWFNSPSGVMDILALDAPSQAQDVNDNGLVVGFGGRTFDLDTLQSTALPPGQLAGTAVLAANNDDDLAGYAANSSQNRRFAVRHTQQFGWEQLGGVVGASANWAAWDINDQGDAVIPFAAYFDEHGLVNFTDLLAPGQGNWSFCNCAGAAINNNGQIAAMAEDLTTFTTGVVLLTPMILGDFNGDAQLNGADIDALVAEIAGGSNTTSFDVTDDGLVNGNDLDSWLALAGNRNLASGNPYLLGDANLDGFVDGTDFVAWNEHKFSDLAQWTAGDFSANGVIDGEDFVIWNGNKFSTADSVTAVPEPGLVLLTAGAAMLATAGRRRSKSFQP